MEPIRCLKRPVGVIRSALAAGSLVVMSVAACSTPAPPTTAAIRTTVHTAPTGRRADDDVAPQRPAALAVGPNGNLYIADDSRNQILERLPNGRFRVVAGSGSPGFRGDGGPAVAAQLNDPTGMTFGPNGTLYFADRENGRVRAVTPAGAIATVAGDGALGWVVTGTPAARATIEPFDVKFGPDGALYVVSEDELLRLERNRTITRIAGVRGAALTGVNGPAAEASIDGANAIAFDRTGGYYLAGSESKVLLRVTPTGTMTLPHGNTPFYPRGNAGIVTTSRGAVIAMDSQSVVNLGEPRDQTIATFASPGPFAQVHNFQPNGIAVSPDGTIFVDTWNGNGYSDAIAIAAISPNNHTVSIVWSHR